MSSGLPNNIKGNLYLDSTLIQTVIKTFLKSVDLATARSNLGTDTTMVQKKGDASSTYSTTSASLVDVDATNLAYTVTIPSGYKLHIMATASMVGTAGGTNESDLAITDTSTSTVLNRQTNNPAVTGGSTPFALNAIVTGDGASHTIKLQFSSSNGIASSIINLANNRTAIMTFMLMPSS